MNPDRANWWEASALSTAPLDTMIRQRRLLGWILLCRCFDHETFFTILLTWLANPKKGIRMSLEPVRWHPRRPRAGGKARRKFSSTGGRAPGYRLSRDHFQTVKRILAPDWAQNMLCMIVPYRGTTSPEFFSWVRTWRLLARSRLVWLIHQRNARSQETFSLI